MKKIPSGSIVCATDFSPNCAKACVAAAAIARRCVKPLVLLHVADQYNAYGATKGELEQLLRPLRRKLKNEARQFALAGLVVGSEVLHGRLAEQAIPKYASDHDAELVIVSAVSKTAFDRWTMGSVSERVAERGAVPTLVIRTSAPFESWASGDRSLKILVGTDFSETAEAPLRWVGKLRKCGPCDVTACYVDWPPEEQRRLGMHGSQPLPENIPEVQRILERDLRERVVGTFGAEPFDIRVEASWGRPDVSLVDLARTMQADLVVMGTHQYRGFQRFRSVSVSRGVLRHAPMSVACVPTRPETSPAANVRHCHRVLAVIDLGEDDELVLPYAYAMVENGGSVRLVCVHGRGRLFNRVSRRLEMGSTNGPGAGHGNEEAIAHIRGLIPVEADERGITTEIELMKDKDVARGICHAVECANADIVCLAQRRRVGQSQRSVPKEVLERCTRPVLVIKPPVR